jgi:hypothetical protein
MYICKKYWFRIQRTGLKVIGDDTFDNALLSPGLFPGLFS